jgi:hypothetical protein
MTTIAEITNLLDDLARLNRGDPDAVARRQQILATKKALIRRLQHNNPPPPAPASALICARPDCTNPVIRRPSQNGRPPVYCSPACRPSRQNHPTRGQISVHIAQTDDDTADNPHPSRSWTVTLRRRNRTVTIGQDLGRFAATALANDLQQLIHPRARQQGGVID